MTPEHMDDSDLDEPRDHEEAKVLPFAFRPRPDWLTGPGDDPFGDSGPGEGAAGGDPDATPQRSILTHPAFSARPSIPASAPFDGDAAGGPETDERTGPGAADARDVADEPAVLAPAPKRPASKAAGWAPAASSVPVLRLALPAEPRAVEREPAARPTARPPGLPGGEEDAMRRAEPTAAARPLAEPWWLVALDTLRTSRRAQIAVTGLLAGVALLSLWLWPRGVGSTPLSEVRRHPTRYDGRQVIVRGRVGDDVFAIGSGWAFYLMQGRDTIVAFARARAPQPHEVLTVKGQVSTGFLDGLPRQALFEDSSGLK
jgi:hypothetical protein